MNETRAKLLTAAAEVVRDHGLVGASARTIATAAGVNQALVFYHFGTVSELVEAASHQALEESVARYRESFDAVATLPGLLEVGRQLQEHEQTVGNVALMAQVMSGAPNDPVLARAAKHAMDTWTAEVSRVVARVLAGSPIAEIADVDGLSRAVSASFIGLVLYEGVDPAGAAEALSALDQLGVLVDVVNDLGPIARRALRAKVRSGRS